MEEGKCSREQTVGERKNGKIYKWKVGILESCAEALEHRTT
jgi:hypothetical protein